MNNHCDIESPLGRLRLIAEDEALLAVLWPEDAVNGYRRVPFAQGVYAHSAVLESAGEQLAQYFAGARRTFDLPYKLVGTDFRRAVWQALTLIPYGETRSYSQISRQLERDKAVRAVGTANGRNPLSIILPCHRVIGADGSLTGFAGGIKAKAWLLAHEQKHLPT